MRIFHTGAETGDLHVFTDPGSSLVSTANPRPPHSLRSIFLFSNGYVDKTIDPISEAYFRWGLKIAAGDTSSEDPLFRLRIPGVFGSPSTQVALTRRVDDRLGAWRGQPSGGTPLGDGGVLERDVFNLIEVHAKIDAAAGVFDVKLNGDLVISFAGNTKGDSVSSMFNQLRWEWGTDAVNVWIDDLAVNDTSGDHNNSWIGDGQIVGLIPDGPGASTVLDIAGSSPPAANWQATDDVPPNDDIDYVESDTPGDRDLYELTDLPLVAIQVNAVAVWARAQKASSGIGRLKRLVRSGGVTDAEAAGAAYSTSWGYTTDARVLDKNPVTGNPWTPAEVNALEAGVEIA